MELLLAKMGSFLLILALGYFLRRKDILPENAPKTLSAIMLNITTPAAIFCSFSGMERDWSLLALAPMGFVVAITPWLAGYLISRKKSRDDKLFWMLGVTMLNTMSCAMPLVQSFLPAQSVVALCFFDLGSSMVTFTGAYSLTALVLLKNCKGKARNREIVRALLASPTAVLYLLMLLLFLANIRLPQMLYSLVAPIGSANTFVAMFMIGSLLEFGNLRKQLKDILALTGVRLLFGLGFAALFYFVLPFSLPIRSMLAVEVVSPISMLAAPQISRLGGDERKLSLATPVSYMTSLLLSIFILFVLKGTGAFA